MRILARHGAAVALLAAMTAWAPGASAAPVLDGVNVFTIGSNPAGLAQDPGGNPIGGVPVINWNHNVTSLGAGPAFLLISAEGIDTNEQDVVLVNGVPVGILTNQGFQVGLFNLLPGPGALPDITAITVSIFDVTGLLVVGLNTITVQVDTENWVNEIEQSLLSYDDARVVPEPGTLALLGLGLAGLALRRRQD